MHKNIKKALSRKLSRGFTLIELLIVITIIGILAAIILPNMQNARERARDARRKADLDSIAKALRLYYNDNQNFPAASGTNMSCPTSPATCAWGGPFVSSNGTNYMNYLPYDPSSTTGTNIAYRYYTGVDRFAVVATLENASDPSIIISQNACAGITTYGARDYVNCAK